MIEYDRGETVRVGIETRDDTDALVDVSKVEIKITDKIGAIIKDTAEADHVSTGVYTFAHTLSEDEVSGETYEVKATVTSSASDIIIRRLSFKVR
jgi:hypothetical protein